MFRVIIGGMYALIAIIFLAVNSWVLGSFGFKWSHDEWTKWGFAAIGAAIPWGLAPILHVAAAKRRAYGGGGIRGFLRGVSVMVPFVAIYTIFVGYNLLGGTGATAFSRSEIQDERDYVIDETARLKMQRASKQKALDGIPQHRATDSLGPLIEAHKKHKFWVATTECADNEIKSKAHRNYCAEYLQLQGEKANAAAADKLQAEIDGIDKQLSQPKRAVSTTDPQVKFLADLTGFDKQKILFLLLLATPLILEAGALYWGNLAIQLLQIRLTFEREDEIQPPMALPATPALTQGPPSTSRHLTGEDLAMQVAVAESFLADCLRHAPGTQEAELKVMSAYGVYAAARNTLPLERDAFRKIAAQRVRSITEVAGTTYYCQVVLCDPPQLLRAAE